MKYRLAISPPTIGGGQGIGESIGRGIQAFAMAPVYAAMAAEEGRDAQARRDLMSSQQRQIDAETALFGQKARDLEIQRERGSIGGLLQTAQLQNGVPLHQQKDFGQYLQTGQMPAQYKPGADDMGPYLPTPKIYQDDTSQKILQTLGLLNTALTVGDNNVANLTRSEQIQRDMNLGDQVIAGTADPTKVSQARFATTGGPAPFEFKEFGTGNQVTGALDESTGAATRFGQLRQSEIRENNAQSAASYASADNSRASADRTRQVTAAGPAGGKPLPSTALKLQHEGLEAIGLASSISADLDAVEKQLNDGTLDLGPFANLISRGQNAAGMSTESSRNFQSFQSMLEKMRNDSLRLNSGVQTEGDAVRAWNELMANINDPALVKQRIGEIKRINQRAVDLKKLQVDMIRANFGQEPLDTSGFTNVAPALGPGATPAAVDPLGIRR